jgi:hypothetical protein
MVGARGLNLLRTGGNPVPRMGKVGSSSGKPKIAFESFVLSLKCDHSAVLVVAVFFHRAAVRIARLFSSAIRLFL